jgi:type VI secretion system secreted protein VgrG
MASYTEAGRPMTVTTPLGPDALLLTGFSGHESISELFSYQVELFTEQKADIAFDKVLGQKVTVNLLLPGEKIRYFSGICSRFSQGERDAHFTVYRMDIVPQFWLLTRKMQSRIFQHLSVPDILKKVLEGLDVAFEIQGQFQPRDYCVQYRETDFNFASRLMEEEGIYYFFTHSSNGHKMVVANTPQSNVNLPEFSKLIFEELEGGDRDEDRVFSWEKTQELRSGKYLLWDHSFELPHKHLEADRNILESLPVGNVTHKLKVGGNDKLQVYEYPGEYAQRFDGINASGGEQPAEIQKIFEDNKRTVEIRMQQEEMRSIAISGTGNCRQMTSGHKFTLQGHFNADGEYTVTSVRHDARLGGYRSDMEEFEYSNSFTCIPSALPFRPARITPKPVVQGSQTAVVVGPSGEEIFTDKYGRIKVQFHWDRDGKYDSDSSCWLRVATSWAGRQWGAIQIPRIGQEVVVAFQEGDPDQPIVMGSVYNADMMPPYKLPDNKSISACKSDSTVGHDGFNELQFEDKKGSERIFIHGEKDLHIRIKNDRHEFIGHDRDQIVGRDIVKQVKRDENVTVDRDVIEKIGRDSFLTIEGKQAIKITGSRSLGVTGNVIEEFQANHSQLAAGNYYLKSPNIVIEGTTALTIKVGSNFIKIDSSGVTIVGTMVNINSGGSPDNGKAESLVAPASPAIPLEPGTAVAGSGNVYNQAASAAEEAGPSYNAAENKDKKSWIAIELMDEEGNPCPGEKYQIKLPDGSIDTGILDEKGTAKVLCDPGTAEITFPDLDKDAWKPK